MNAIEVRRAAQALFLFLGLTGPAASQAIPNWSVPPTWTPPKASHRGARTEADLFGPLPFVPVTPCRQYDSRNDSPLPQATPRLVSVVNAPCGIPAFAQAVSANVTVFAITGATGNGVFEIGTVNPPTTAWINYPPSETQRANAGVLATDGSGGIWVQVQQGGGSVQFVVDVNGYYSVQPADQNGIFKVINGAGGGGAAIWGETFGSGTNSTGVLGFATSASGVTDGVWGRNLSSSDFAAAVLATQEASSGRTYGVYGRTVSSSFYTAGVYGEAVGPEPSGNLFGVQGSTSSHNGNSAGVYGVASSTNANGGRFENTGSAISTLLCTSVNVTGWGLYTDSKIRATDFRLNGVSSFVSPHPLDASRQIQYTSVEAPTVDVYFRGTGTLANGYARIEVPEHFRLTARDATYMTTLTPIGRPTGSSLTVESEGPEGVVVRGNGNIRFHYVVYAERAEIEENDPTPRNTDFTPEALEKAHMLLALPASTRALLVRNGTLNPDGTYNEQTARAMGWTIPKSPEPAIARPE